MFGMTPDEISALAAVAQTLLALAALIGSVAVSMLVWYGTRRIAKLDYERSIREAWIAVDTAALSNDQMLVMADTLMDPKNENDDLERRRRRWFAYTVLNAITSSYFGAKHNLTQSQKVTIEGCRQLLGPLLRHDEIFEITQGHGYEDEFSEFCREIRKEQMKLPASGMENEQKAHNLDAAQDGWAGAHPPVS